jgi:hypothetical protein
VEAQQEHTLSHLKPCGVVRGEPHRLRVRIDAQLPSGSCIGWPRPSATILSLARRPGCFAIPLSNARQLEPARRVVGTVLKYGSRSQTRTAKEKPKHATHASPRMLAAEIGVGHTTVQRVWKEHGPDSSRLSPQTLIRPHHAAGNGATLQQTSRRGFLSTYRSAAD